MGASISKEGDREEEVCKGVIPSTPVSAIKQRILNLEGDPRSPSSNISRTPIEIFKKQDSLEVKSETPLKILSLQDPRSPTLEIFRTPIVIKDKVKSEIKPHNKLLDNVKNAYQFTPIKNDNQETVKSPILLETTPISVKLSENKRNSLVGLLETNLDFIETDIDEVYQSKLENSINKSEEEQDLEEEVTTPQTEPKEEKEQEFLEEETKELQTSSPEKAVEELDRKLTDLIYEDKIQVNSITPKVREDCRTPLADKNARIAKLKVNNHPTKLSKIPVYKNKPLNYKSQIQCENTPPRTRETGKIGGKISQWGAEDSIII